MERLFPRALLACIAEGRPPHPRELSLMTDKVHREAFPRSPDTARQLALRVARAALVGQPLASI